jgi:hypothetical protein
MNVANNTPDKYIIPLRFKLNSDSITKKKVNNTGDRVDVNCSILEIVS